jgi:hypothetical protein
MRMTGFKKIGEDIRDAGTQASQALCESRQIFLRGRSTAAPSVSTQTSSQCFVLLKKILDNCFSTI